MNITRLEYGEPYYYVNSLGLVSCRKERYGVFDHTLYRKKNYFLELKTAIEFADIYRKTLNDFWNKRENK